MKIEEPDSKFLKVKCSDCGNEQTVFNKASTKVECNNCGTVICEPTGGMAEIKTNIKEVYR